MTSKSPSAGLIPGKNRPKNHHNIAHKNNSTVSTLLDLHSDFCLPFIGKKRRPRQSESKKERYSTTQEKGREGNNNHAA